MRHCICFIVIDQIKLNKQTWIRNQRVARLYTTSIGTPLCKSSNVIQKHERHLQLKNKRIKHSKPYSFHHIIRLKPPQSRFQSNIEILANMSCIQYLKSCLKSTKLCSLPVKSAAHWSKHKPMFETDCKRSLSYTSSAIYTARKSILLSVNFMRAKTNRHCLHYQLPEVKPVWSNFYVRQSSNRPTTRANAKLSQTLPTCIPQLYASYETG